MFYAVIGKPIGHSRSPLMQNTALRAVGMQEEYRAVEIEPANLERDIHKLVAEGCAGFNVTIPHKEAILPLLSSLSDEAKQIGAVNTVVVRNGSMHGYNTDVDGLRASLLPYRDAIRGAHALVLGAGGAARSAVFSLINDFSPSHLTLAARSTQKAQKLADEFSERASLSVCSLSGDELQKAVKQASVIVNTTPLGMQPDVNSSPLPDTAQFHRGQIIFDLIYIPLQSTLLRHASTRGATTINGIEMLVQQGAKAFELFTGKQMPVNTVRDVLVKSLT